MHSERRDRPIVSMHTEPSPAIAMGSAILELVPKLLNLNKVLIVVLVLLRWVIYAAAPYN